MVINKENIIRLNSNFTSAKPLITKEAILDSYTSLELFNAYIKGLSVGKPILSPLRKEGNPSFSIFKSTADSETYLFKDHGSGKHGDIFKFIQELYNVNYIEAIKKVGTDLGMNNIYNCGTCSIIELIPDKEKERIKKEIEPFNKLPNTIEIEPRKWEVYDIKYWNLYGIKLSTLKKYNVVPIKGFKIRSLYHLADKFAYAFIEKKDEKTTYKIYQPYNIIGFKWRTTHDSSVWQGWEQLPIEGEIVIVTKSLKDVMSIVDNTPFSAVSLQSETVMPKDDVMQGLSDRFMNVMLLYDNDFEKEKNIGQIQAEKIKDNFRGMANLVNISIPDRYRAKDFSDFIKGWGITYASKTLISKVEDVKMPF